MTREEIANILSELDADLKKSAEEATEILKKAGEEKEDASSPADESESGDAGGPPPPDASAAPAAPAPDASAAPAPDASAAPAGPDAGAMDPAAQQGPMTPEALTAEYAQLPPEELDMHIQAALAAKESMAGAAGPAAGMPPAGAPPAGGGMPPAGPDASAGGPPMMGKEEMKINKEANGGKITEGVKKSEASTDDLLKSIQAAVKAGIDAQLKPVFEKLATLEKTQAEDAANIVNSVKLVLEQPVRKSVASISELNKSEAKPAVKPMTRKDVDNFIKENAAKMNKSERDLWIDFVNNKVPASKLAPMLERLSSSNK